MQFRNWTRGISAALGAAVGGGGGGGSEVSGAGSGSLVFSDEEEQVNTQQLVAMLGCDAGTALRALHATDGNVDRAAELVLEQTYQHHVPETSNHNNDGVDQNDADLSRALEQSMVDEQQRRQRQQKQKQSPKQQTPNQAQQTQSTQTPIQPLQSAASRRAGEAAVARSKQSTSTTRDSNNKNNNNNNNAVRRHNHHPQVKIIPALHDKSKEEQILRTAFRLKSTPTAVDTLHRALSTLRQHPYNATYRTMDTSHPAFQRNVGDAPGAHDLLLAMNFQKTTTPRSHSSPGRGVLFVLDESRVDPALLYLGISALEQTKLTAEYQHEKRLIVFQKELDQIVKNDENPSKQEEEEETSRRLHYRTLAPPEPAIGHGALLQIKMGTSMTIRRRFDSDDTLLDVLHWLGTYGSALPDRLMKMNTNSSSSDWTLINLNHFPATPLPCFGPHVHSTLQYLGCWPSGKLEIVPTTTASTTPAIVVI